MNKSCVYLLEVIMMNKVLLSQRFSTIIHKQMKTIFWDFVEGTRCKPGLQKYAIPVTALFQE